MFYSFVYFYTGLFMYVFSARSLTQLTRALTHSPK
jgi:hypothetical protein